MGWLKVDGVVGSRPSGPILLQTLVAVRQMLLWQVAAFQSPEQGPCLSEFGSLVGQQMLGQLCCRQNLWLWMACQSLHFEEYMVGTQNLLQSTLWLVVHKKQALVWQMGLLNQANLLSEARLEHWFQRDWQLMKKAKEKNYCYLYAFSRETFSIYTHILKTVMVVPCKLTQKTTETKAVVHTPVLGFNMFCH